MKTKASERERKQSTRWHDACSMERAPQREDVATMAAAVHDLVAALRAALQPLDCGHGVAEVLLRLAVLRVGCAAPGTRTTAT
jgi:hypothetical protein